MGAVDDLLVGGVQHLEGRHDLAARQGFHLDAAAGDDFQPLGEGLHLVEGRNEAGQLVWIFSVSLRRRLGRRWLRLCMYRQDIMAVTANAASPDRNLFIVLPPS